MTRSRVDWSQLWHPGPAREFSADELARAAGDGLGPTFRAVLAFNLAISAFALLQVAPPQATSPLSLLLGACVLIGLWGGRRLWRQPSRRELTKVTLFGSLAVALAMIASIAWHDAPRGSSARDWVRGVGVALTVMLALAWWFAALYRAQQIEGRLREQDERQRAVALARRLGAAQLQPHFLFNSLASLQHWVQQRDDRAAPMLQALTDFLRATLPLFDREWLAIGDEAEAARRYLDVMRLRLGERLRPTVEIAAEAAALSIPPGVVLTLVENAIEHGAMPSLSGADVTLRARVAGGRAIVEVQDSGPGPVAGTPDGVGLANVRARLAEAFGADARLTLQAADGGGCLARIDWPLPKA